MKGLTSDGYAVFASGVNQVKVAAPSFDAWHHYAVCTYNSILGLSLEPFVDGNTVGIPSAAVTPRPSFSFTVGQAAFPGHIDEIRVSTGRRYAPGFVPERRHTVDAQTTLLLHCDDPPSSTTLTDSSSNAYAVAKLSGTLDPDTGYTAAMCK